MGRGMSFHDDEFPESIGHQPGKAGAAMLDLLGITATAIGSATGTQTDLGLARTLGCSASISSEISNSPTIEISPAALEAARQFERDEPGQPAEPKRSWRILDRETCWHECKGERLIRNDDWIEIWDIGPTRLVAAFWQPAAVIEK